MTEADRLAREQAFHDVAFAENTREQVGRFYATARSSEEFYLRELLRRCPSADVLEYGCGQGSSAYAMAHAGARRVTGIDISPVAIDQAAERAERERVADRCSFAVMNAEVLDFPDASFDFSCGTAILHHLDLDNAFRELARTLRPGGSALFYEPLGHNPAVNLYRRRTPHLRTEDEHPFRWDDLAAAERHFGKVERRFFHLATLAASAVHGRRPFESVLGGLERVDRALFRFLPASRRWAWVVVMSLAEPRHG